jgi:DNA-binding transcriptional LysR family regulator
MQDSHGFSTDLLRVFVAVARHGSFTAAARELGYTQSAISRQVAALEEEADAVLFDRLPRGVGLTEPGRRLLHHAHLVLRQLQAARRELADLRELASGRLRVGAFATAAAWLVPRAIAQFRTAYPGIVVNLKEGFTPQLVVMLAEGEADIAIVSGEPGEEIEGVELLPLRDDFMYVAFPAGHRLAGRSQVELSELADEDWIAGSARPEETLISACLRTGFRPRIGFVARDWMAKQGCVAAGLGITLLPSLAVDAARTDIAIAALNRNDIPARQVSAALPAGLAVTPAAQAFLELLTSQSAPHRAVATIATVAAIVTATASAGDEVRT